ncbi:MAG: hypothetical protein Q9163_003919 [Psora crenata]
MYFRRGIVCLLSAAVADTSPLRGRQSATCQKTSVAIFAYDGFLKLVSDVGTQQALSNASITDFLIVEYNSDIGGRVAHTTFGKQPDGTPYTIELGANWVQGLVTPPGPENPIWTLVKKYNVTNYYSNFSNVQTFTDQGSVDYNGLFDAYEDAYSTVEQDAGYILADNLQDRTFRSGLSLAGWKPMMDKRAEAIEWFLFDFEYAFDPNTTYYQFSGENNYVYDQRGFNTFIKGEASTFLKPNDSRLLLNTVVTNITYTDHGVTVYNKDGGCITADYAICTFSLGVLQHDAVTFSPELPSWKRRGIETFAMGTYTKIFLQFPPEKIFWNTSYQYFLYADPYERGYYPLFQTLDTEGFLPGSGIIFVTVVQDQSYIVEAQDDETTKAQVMAVLRNMFGVNNVPDPIDFLYPRWTLEPWAYGSYSNWPPGTSLEAHQNLRANVGRLYFAGEATSAQYYGFLHGAYFEGQSVANHIAECVHNGQGRCDDEVHYEVLRGTTDAREYNAANGWEVTSFQTNGLLIE